MRVGVSRAGQQQPVYVVARPKTGSKAKLRWGDKRFAISQWKPDKTLHSLLQAYDIGLSKFLLSIPNVQLDEGGRNGTRVAYRQSRESAAQQPAPADAEHQRAMQRSGAGRNVQTAHDVTR